MKTLILLLVLISFWVFSPAADASLCRHVNHQFICILNIKRSAKNYWEYRASVSVDGIARPIEVYDCRHRLKVQQDGMIVSFNSDRAGELICNLFNKK